eukprot:2021828-Heterocapsa_arctica.AAC.1
MPQCHNSVRADTTWNEAHGGVGILTRLPAVATRVYNKECVRQRSLFESTRWVMVRIPLANNKFVYVVSYYGISGASIDDHKNTANDRGLENIFSVLAGLGDVPI